MARVMLRALCSLLLLFFLLQSNGEAAQIVHESLERVLARAATVVIVDVVSAVEVNRGSYSVDVALRARPVKTLDGARVPEQMLNCRYSQGRPHRRGNLDVSPLVFGSGMEFDVKQGDRVILLLADRPTAGLCKIVRIEPLQNETLLIKHGRNK